MRCPNFHNLVELFYLVSCEIGAEDAQGFCWRFPDEEMSGDVAPTVS